MKKIISLFLLFVFTLLPVSAKNLPTSKARVYTEFNIVDNEARIIEFASKKNIKISPEVDIPPTAKIKVQVIQSQKERRSGDAKDSGSRRRFKTK